MVTRMSSRECEQRNRLWTPVLCSLESVDQMSYNSLSQNICLGGKGGDRAIRTWAKLWELLQVCGGSEQLAGAGRSLYLPPSLLSQA